jgi:hypothetical protein
VCSGASGKFLRYWEALSPWSNKSKATPPKVFFLFLFLFLYLIPRKFASSKNILKPSRSFCKKDVSNWKEFGTSRPSPSQWPKLLPIVIEGLSLHRTCTLPGTHLTHPMLESTGSHLVPLGFHSTLWWLFGWRQKAVLWKKHKVRNRSAMQPKGPSVLMPTCAKQPVQAGPRTPQLGVQLLTRAHWQASFLASKQTNSSLVLGPVPHPALRFPSLSLSCCLARTNTPNLAAGVRLEFH